MESAYIYYIYILVSAISGLAVGSFLNVCIDRLPRGESLLNPPSHCQACQHRLAARDLIPLVSYLGLHGRCRYCHARIPKRLLLVELATAVMFSFLCWRWGFTPQSGIMAFYTCLFIIIFMVDLEHGLILNKVVYPAMAIALLLALLLPQPWITQLKLHGIANFAAGGGIGLVLFLLIAIASRGGMGWGDVKLATLIGIASGFPLVFVALLMGTIMGGVVAAFLLLTGRKGRREPIPFGPFLSLAALITLLWGNNILNWYLSSMWIT